jgi:hypothetical protein
MKHVHMMTKPKPSKADEVAWVSLKNIFGFAPLTYTQGQWVSARVDQGLRK